MKTATVNKAFAEILESIDKHTLLCSYFGGSNLVPHYLNDSLAASKLQNKG